ncbi:alpha/beta hydrolase, partial [Nocardioides humilatus]
RSDKPLIGYDVARLSDDLLAVLDRLGVETCSLVGWSFGGQVACRTAALHPDRVHRLVLAGSNAVRASRSEESPFGRPPEPSIEAMVAMEIVDRYAARRSSISCGFGTTPVPAVVVWMTALAQQV